jgi:alpha-amylase/alpha-mannosidase (GH57 family)
VSYSPANSLCPLTVCFVWHMHQPDYKDHRHGWYKMPWVRLHGVKDYLDMPRLLEDFPNIRQTFNLVPSLLEQLEDYCQPGIWDRHQALTVACHYSDDDKHFILERFFDANPTHMIGRSPYFSNLLERRNRALAEATASSGEAFNPLLVFTDQEYADITALFHLVWTDPRWLAEDPELAALWAKGSHFNQIDRVLILERHRHLLCQILPTYKRMQEQDLLEVSVTPYYHPILPLLIDHQSARVAMPDASLPDEPFAFPEDARAQMRMAVERYEYWFGCKPRGVWPSEQSVSPEVLKLFKDMGLNWTISSEGVLARSLDTHWEKDGYGQIKNIDTLLRPYTYNGVNLLFRNLTLSDLIGFAYQTMEANQAADDCYGRLKFIQQQITNTGSFTSDGQVPAIVTIALDGENCWESYHDDGIPFLRALYQRLQDDPTFNVATISQALAQNKGHCQPLPKLHSGSWIEDSFRIWIGDPVKNVAWNYLARARQTLVDAIASRPVPADIQHKAWREIYIAEGSDWFWWFGEPHHSGQDERFDEQFRLHLQSVYTLLGHPIPVELTRPVPAQHVQHTLPPVGLITPPITGQLADMVAWQLAGRYDCSAESSGHSAGVMHREDRPLKRFYFGEDGTTLFLRFELARDLIQPDQQLCVYGCAWDKIRYNSPMRLKRNPNKTFNLESYLFAYELKLEGLSNDGVLRASGAEAVEQSLWVDRPDWQVQLAMGDGYLDVALPLASFGLQSNEQLGLVVAVAKHDVVSELLPVRYPVMFRRSAPIIATPSYAIL